MNKVIIPIIFVLLLVPVVSSQVFAQSEPEIGEINFVQERLFIEDLSPIEII